MSEPIWNQFLTERDKQVFASGGFGSRQGFGKRPAILVVDMNYNFCGDKPEPILESIKRWRNSCGLEAWEGIAAIKRLLAAGRAKGLPVIYTTGIRRADNWDAGGWAWKNKRTTERQKAQTTGEIGDTIVPEIGPQPQDIIIYKQKPSAFFGTNLMSYMMLLGADSILLTGSTTSGCVRATAVDAFSTNIKTTIVEEGCFDRSQASHAINLCDMQAKYADVVKLEEVLQFVNSLPSNLFDLPKHGAFEAPKLAASK
ncbi:MAG TPA: isochorismatase family protein [Burkholderiales bacterium]|nr:isochorismatase family protein [Burkholderiales bacterium]